MTNLTVTDSFRSLEAEVGQLREHVQIQARHTEVIEVQLAKLMEELSMGSEVVAIRDEIWPLFDGVCLRSDPAGDGPYRSVESVPGGEAAPTQEDWWPTNRRTGNYLVPNSGWQNHSIQGATSLVIAFSLFGLERTEIEKHLEQIRRHQSIAGNFVPIFFTDATCIDVFRHHGYVFEYFPSPEKRRAYNGSMDWATYARKRLDLLIRKWGAAKLIVFGERTIMTDTLEDQPREDEGRSMAAGGDRFLRPQDDDLPSDAGRGISAMCDRATVAANGEWSGLHEVQRAECQSRSVAASKGNAGGENGHHEASDLVNGAATSALSHVTFYPDYREANPYQTLLYGNLPKHITCEGGTIHDALMHQASGDRDGSKVFHVHWEDAVIKNEPSESAARTAATKFVEALRLFRSRGGAIVWTVHNVASHDGLYLNVQDSLCRDLSRLAHRIHFHSDAACRVASARFAPPEDKVTIVQHGNYDNLIDTSEPRDVIRGSLGYRPDDCVFIHFGRIMRYKGTEDLLRAFSSLKSDRAKLIIAGKVLDPLGVDGLSDECRSRVDIYEGRLKQVELSRLVRAADFSVLPYRRVLTSGSVLFSMSAGVPAIVPNLPTIREMVEPERQGLLFEAGNWKDLAAKLRQAVSMSDGDWRCLADGALDEAKKWDWSQLAESYATLFSQAIENAGSGHTSAMARSDRKPFAPLDSAADSRAA